MSKPDDQTEGEFSEIEEPLQIEEAKGDWRMAAKPLPEAYPYWTMVIAAFVVGLIICVWNGYIRF